MATTLLTRCCKNLLNLSAPNLFNRNLSPALVYRSASTFQVFASGNKSALFPQNCNLIYSLSGLNYGMFRENPLLAANGGTACMQIRCYQNVLRPRLICDGCYFVWRHGRRHVECSDHPRHKQMKKLSPRKIWKEDYSIGNINRAFDWNRKIHRAFYRTVDRTAVSHNWLADKLGKEV